MIKAVLFDLDGTLLNRDASLLKFVEGQYDRFSNWLTEIPREKYIARFIELDCRGYVWKDKVYQQLLEEFNVTDLSWETLLQDYITEFHHSCIPFSNLRRTLECLKNHSIQLGMITNGFGQFQMDNIRALGIQGYFHTILISEWEGIKKPNPDIFHRALLQLQVLPNEVMFVGDHPINDMKGAKDAGMWTIWRRDIQWKKVDTDYIIEDLNEIPLIIQQLNKS
ncbi:HAD family hydrolase [Ornithinibacillus halotolerans]|uniref:Haloacid dehalogenase n=1 Tax=Ornithinibacillus halotolerans TaxID=1274357 RepID=A0A916W9N8_9BACI|nr:HAD family hydrolase [Ornithinibacillus halotolerans]GGA78535.1 haloacid dehalogenase [Ornithinibacillus halotolerans]